MGCARHNLQRVDDVSTATFTATCQWSERTLVNDILYLSLAAFTAPACPGMHCGIDGLGMTDRSSVSTITDGQHHGNPATYNVCSRPSPDLADCESKIGGNSPVAFLHVEGCRCEAVRGWLVDRDDSARDYVPCDSPGQQL